VSDERQRDFVGRITLIPFQTNEEMNAADERYHVAHLAEGIKNDWFSCPLCDDEEDEPSEHDYSFTPGTDRYVELENSGFVSFEENKDG